MIDSNQFVLQISLALNAIPPIGYYRPPMLGRTKAGYWLLFYWFTMIFLWLLHGWMLLQLGTQEGDTSIKESLLRLTSDEPLFSGQHALHQHHGKLGLIPSYTPFIDQPVTDLAYQAGYIKSPWFDGASRPAEVFRLLQYFLSPAASYKVGVMLTWLFVPFTVCLATKGLGVRRPVVIIANFLTVLWCWSAFGQQVLTQGDLDVVWGSCSLMLAMSWLGRSLITVSFWLFLCWLFPMIAALFFWPFLGPVILFILLTSLALALGRRTHGAFPEIVGGGILVYLVSLPWLVSGWKLWWYIAEPTLVVSTGTMQSIFPFTIAPISNALGISFSIAALCSLFVMKLYGLLRTQAWPLAAACGCGLIGALVAPSWINAPLVLPHRWWIAVQIWGTLPAATLLVLLVRWMTWLARSKWLAMLILVLLSGTLAWSLSENFWNKCRKEIRVKPWSIGQPPLMKEMLAAIATHTTPSARILLEESSSIANWSPLLAQASQRQFMGGLGAASAIPIEPLSLRLQQGNLMNRSVAEWTDADLQAWCQRYNIGWIIAEKRTQTRLNAWKQLDPPIQINGDWQLYRLNRETTFAILGKAQIESIEDNAITLIDLEPTEGQVVLSFHYWKGMQTSNQRAKLLPWAVPEDNQPMIKLELNSPLPRLRISW